jgi:hypothetical protein
MAMIRGRQIKRDFVREECRPDQKRRDVVRSEMQKWERQVHRFVSRPIAFALFGAWLIGKYAVLGILRGGKFVRRWMALPRSPRLIQIGQRR